MPTLDGRPTLEERVAKIERKGSLPAQHIRRWQLGAYLFVIALGVVMFWQNDNRIDENSTAVAALCQVRENYETSTAATQTILNQLAPGQTIVFTIPVKLIQQGLDRDLKTLAALQSLDCG